MWCKRWTNAADLHAFYHYESWHTNQTKRNMQPKHFAHESHTTFRFCNFASYCVSVRGVCRNVPWTCWICLLSDFRAIMRHDAFTLNSRCERNRIANMHSCCFFPLNFRQRGCLCGKLKLMWYARTMHITLFHIPITTFFFHFFLQSNDSNSFNASFPPIPCIIAFEIMLNIFQK